MRGTLRWARADLRARRGQAALTIGVVAGVVAALVVAIMLLEGSLNPWRGLFERTHGADVLVYFSGPGPSSNTQGRLGLMPGIEAVAAPYQAASATLEQGATKFWGPGHRAGPPLRCLRCPRRWWWWVPGYVPGSRTGR